MPTAIVGDFGMGLPNIAQPHKDDSYSLPKWIQPLAFYYFISEDQSMALLFVSPTEEHPENEILQAGQSLRMLIWQVGAQALTPCMRRSQSSGDVHPAAESQSSKQTVVIIDGGWRTPWMLQRLFLQEMLQEPLGPSHVLATCV